MEMKSNVNLGIIMKTVVLILVASFMSLPAYSLDFEKVWQSYFENSDELRAIREEKKAYELGTKRASLHWAPKVYVMGNWFDTNDPGQVLFNTLGQRAMKQTDFVPNNLNHPD